MTGTPAALREIVYRMDAPVRGAWPGRHRSRSGDGGFEFRAHLPLQDAPDARRLDLQASLREPFGRWLVRANSQRLAVPVVLLADLSASMAHDGGSDAEAPGNAVPRQQVLADLTDSLAWSVWKSGDSFGFFGCTDQLLPDWTLLPSRARGAGAGLAERLRRHQPDGRSAEGLLQVAPLLGRRRALVFIASDFHLPLSQIDRLLAGLATHQVVPVLLARPDEPELGPRQGLVPLLDAETGQRRLVWWRPALRQRWQAQWAERTAGLQAMFRRHRLRPVSLPGVFDADVLTRHFQA